MDMQTKSFEIKQLDAEGQFEAVIATLGVVDHDGDLTEKGAFGTQEVIILPAHDARSVALGKATITERGKKVIATGQLNLEIPAAKDLHSALKFDLGTGKEALQEWSYGFRIEKAKDEIVDGVTVRHLLDLKVFEISPVLRGAGRGTGTLAVKTKDHVTKTSNEPWDVTANFRRIKDAKNPPQSVDESLFASVTKSHRCLLHHFVTEDGEAGPASTRACIRGIAELNGLNGQHFLDGDQRQKAYDHLAAHLKDANFEASLLSDKGGVSLADELKIAAWDVEGAAARTQKLVDLRAKDGRTIGKDARASLKECVPALAEAVTTFKSLQSFIGDGDGPRIEDLLEAEFVALQSRMAGLPTP